MKRLICSVLFYIAVALTASATFAQEMRERVIAWPPPPGKFIGPAVKGHDGKLTASGILAVEIVEVLAAGSPVNIGQPFTADDEWLRSFSVRMRNISDKPIVGARMDFGMPEARRGETYLGSNLGYGIGAGTGKGLRDQRQIMPGEEFVLTRSGEAYGRDQRFLKEKSGVENISHVRLGLAWVKFGDGKLWIGQARERAAHQ